MAVALYQRLVGVRFVEVPEARAWHEDVRLFGETLAHEVGHIVARHSQRRQQRSLWRMLGVVAISAITGSERLTQIAGAAAGLFTLRYSRSQEYEADDLGLGFLHRAGYDPFATVDMLSALGRHEEYLTRVRGVDEARSIPEWARTHPLTDNRLERAEDSARGTGIGRGALPEREAEYMRVVDDLLYGDDPVTAFARSTESLTGPLARTISRSGVRGVLAAVSHERPIFDAE